MAKKNQRKDAGLSIALLARDRSLIDKAANALELPPSVWGRAVLLKEANRVVGEAVAARKAPR